MEENRRVGLFTRTSVQRNRSMGTKQLLAKYHDGGNGVGIPCFMGHASLLVFDVEC